VGWEGKEKYNKSNKGSSKGLPSFLKMAKQQKQELNPVSNRKSVERAGNIEKGRN